MAMCEINSPPSLHAVLSLQVKAGKDEGEEWMMGSYSTQRLLYSCLGLDLLAAFFFWQFPLVSSHSRSNRPLCATALRLKIIFTGRQSLHFHSSREQSL